MATVLDDTHLSWTPQLPMDSFVSHLAALLAVYDLGPQASIPIPHYDGPTDLRTDTILKSLSTIVHRMWSAEDVLGKHNLNLDAANGTTIAGLSAVHEGQHVHRCPPGEDGSDLGEETDANEDKSCESDDTTPNDKPFTRANMSISLESLPPSVDPSKFYSRVYNATKVQQYTNGQNPFGYNSAPPTSNAHCPT